MFWAAWPASPNKLGENQARSWWVARDLEADAARIVAAVKVLARSRQWTKAAGRYIPRPLGWLKADGWREELSWIRREIAEGTMPNFGGPPLVSEQRMRMGAGT